jgi:hypothetical protein
MVTRRCEKARQILKGLESNTGERKVGEKGMKKIKEGLKKERNENMKDK